MTARAVHRSLGADGRRLGLRRSGFHSGVAGGFTKQPRRHAECRFEVAAEMRAAAIKCVRKVRIGNEVTWKPRLKVSSVYQWVSAAEESKNEQVSAKFFNPRAAFGWPGGRVAGAKRVILFKRSPFPLSAGLSPG